MLTRRAALRTISHAITALAIGATIPLTAAEQPFQPVQILLRETWSDGRQPTIGRTWLLAPCQRPVRYVHTCGDVTIVNEEVTG